jgi:hypothetical protein
MTQISLTKRAKSICLNVPSVFSSQEIDSHYATESGSTDYSRNSCRMRYYYHPQLFEITRA